MEYLTLARLFILLNNTAVQSRFKLCDKSTDWWDNFLGLCKVRMRTADADGGRRTWQLKKKGKKIVKITFREIILNVKCYSYQIRNDRNFSSFIIYVQLRTTYVPPCRLVLMQKWQVPKHLDLKGRLMSGQKEIYVQESQNADRLQLC